jgi:RNA polymerase sigma-70 factor (ECF subfamily)
MAPDGVAKDSIGTFETHRGFLTGLAYRMLGSVVEAEDAVQDTWLRWHGANRDGIANARAWLPDPLLDDVAQMPPETIDHDVSVALMLALERLSPLERAAFLLHDIFDMSYGEVAATLGNAEDNCRQLASRARRHVRDARPRYAVHPEDGQPMADAFLAASRSGDTAQLQHLLAADARLMTDGGGLKTAALNPILGAERIERFFTGLARKRLWGTPLWQQAVRINGMPGWAMVERDGTLQTLALDISQGRITAIYITRNPEKLRHLARHLPPEAAALISNG